MFTAMDATRNWLAWSGAIWSQQIKMSQIMFDAMAASSAEAVWGIRPTVKEPPKEASEETAPCATRAEALERARLVELTPARPRGSRRQPATPPGLPPRRTHATPV
ncbi:hypothetical protein [Roseivivax sp.]